jgi:hypothetical protein
MGGICGRTHSGGVEKMFESVEMNGGVELFGWWENVDCGWRFIGVMAIFVEEDGGCETQAGAGLSTVGTVRGSGQRCNSQES